MNSNSGLGGVGQAVGLSMAPRTAGGANSKEVAAGGFWERGFGSGGHDLPAPGWDWGGCGDLPPSRALTPLLTSGQAQRGPLGLPGTAQGLMA